MKVVSVAAAQALRVLRPSGGFGYRPDAIKAVVERYQFVEFPRQPSEILPTDTSVPIVFRHGRLPDSAIVMERLEIYPAGLTVTTLSNTDDALVALDQVLDWASEHFRITFERVREPGFWSQLNVRFERQLGGFFPKLEPLARELSDKHPDFISFRPEYSLGALHFTFESKQPNVTPIPFRIERALNVPYSENLYVSDGALTTQDHIAILEKFERTLP
jgi:hypothetical protein